MVISASWISRANEGNGTINNRGVATLLALASFLKRMAFTAIMLKNANIFETGYSHWSKDVVFVVSDGYLDGMQAWLSSYHGAVQSGILTYPSPSTVPYPSIGLNADPLELTSGVIWTALNIDYAGHSFSHLGLFFGLLTTLLWVPIL